MIDMEDGGKGEGRWKKGMQVYRNRFKESGNSGASSWVLGARELLRLPILSLR
jgi:hypothetical protein